MLVTSIPMCYALLSLFFLAEIKRTMTMRNERHQNVDLQNDFMMKSMRVCWVTACWSRKCTFKTCAQNTSHRIRSPLNWQKPFTWSTSIVLWVATNCCVILRTSSNLSFVRRQQVLCRVRFFLWRWFKTKHYDFTTMMIWKILPKALKASFGKNKVDNECSQQVSLFLNYEMLLWARATKATFQFPGVTQIGSDLVQVLASAHTISKLVTGDWWFVLVFVLMVQILTFFDFLSLTTEDWFCCSCD